MEKYTDLDALEVYEKDYNNIKNNTDENVKAYDNEIQYINTVVLRYLARKVELKEDKERYIRDRWFRYHLFKRIVRLFKVKCFYRSKKAHDYYLKYINKKPKFQKTEIGLNADEFKDILTNKMKTYLVSGDEKKAESYNVVLNDLFKGE